MKFLAPALFICALLPFQLFAQSRISGIVIDKQSKQPVDYASVYINGTTHGTLTDSLGKFNLENVRIPCTLVISHLNYIVQSKEIEAPLTAPLNISLRLKINEISEVNIQERNLRGENMITFRDQFLGTDVWGKNAVIENEEVILFSRDYVQKQSKVISKQFTNFQQLGPGLQWSDDSTMITYTRPANLKATSLKPLKINLPLLGYILYYDLIGFISEYKEGLDADLSVSLGYSYFVPVPFKSKRDSIRIMKNREKVYYNSSQHFCKSLYEHNLAQNGYKLLEHDSIGTTKNNTASKFYFSDTAATIDKNSLPSFKKQVQIQKKEVTLDTCLHQLDENIILTGLKDKKFDIHYYSFTNNKPKDLTLLKATKGKISEVIFTMDTCIIRNDGTVPDNSIIFGKEIGLKKVGAMLPGGYQPSK